MSNNSTIAVCLSKYYQFHRICKSARWSAPHFLKSMFYFSIIIFLRMKYGYCTEILNRISQRTQSIKPRFFNTTLKLNFNNTLRQVCAASIKLLIVFLDHISVYHSLLFDSYTHILSHSHSVRIPMNCTYLICQKYVIYYIKYLDYRFRFIINYHTPASRHFSKGSNC